MCAREQRYLAYNKMPRYKDDAANREEKKMQNVSSLQIFRFFIDDEEYFGLTSFQTS